MEVIKFPVKTFLFLKVSKITANIKNNFLSAKLKSAYVQPLQPLENSPNINEKAPKTKKTPKPTPDLKKTTTEL